MSPSNGGLFGADQPPLPHVKCSRHRRPSLRTRSCARSATVSRIGGEPEGRSLTRSSDDRTPPPAGPFPARSSWRPSFANFEAEPLGATGGERGRVDLTA